MFVQSVFPHDRLEVLQTDVLYTAFSDCILGGADTYEYLLFTASLQCKNIVKAELQTNMSKIRTAVNNVAIQKVYQCVPILLRTQNWP